MRDRYYRLEDATDVPDRSVLVRIWQEEGEILASIEGEDEQDATAPDLVLLRAALLRLRENLMAVFIQIEDQGGWQADWGDLVDYRVTQKNGKPALRFAQPPPFPQFYNLEPGQTLNLNSITSPSLTT